MLSVSKSPSMDFSIGRRITSIRPFSASVCTHQALDELKRVTTCVPFGNIPVDLIGFKSLSAVPERRTDLRITSAWNSSASQISRQVAIVAGAAATTAIENLGGFKPGGMAGQGKKIISDLAGKTTKEAVKTLVKKGVKSGVSEGLEEIPQQYTGAYGGGTDIKDLNTTENAQDAAFGAAMAFPGGAMFGSVNTVSDHYKAKRNEALDQTASTGPLGNALASGGLANTDTFNSADGSIIDSTAVDIAANSHASSYDQLFQQAESNYGLPSGLLSTMGFHESGFDPNAPRPPPR